MNVVLDTNVLLSAALRDKLPEQVVVHVATHDEVRWIATQSIVAEYVDVLRRPKFGLSAEIIARWSELIDMRTVLVADPRHLASGLRDPLDAKFVAAAIAADAEFLVTGDRDLLDAKLTIRTRVLTVAEFADIVGLAK